MTNATEKLRTMLDELGVDWTKPKSATEHMQTTFLHDGWGVEVLERSIGLCVTATNLFDTPEQAIAATLGSGTCEVSYKELWWTCGYCGESWRQESERPGYCPNCGAKVVER